MSLNIKVLFLNAHLCAIWAHAQERILAHLKESFINVLSEPGELLNMKFLFHSVHDVHPFN
jgi:hypothetical protein